MKQCLKINNNSVGSKCKFDEVNFVTTRDEVVSITLCPAEVQNPTNVTCMFSPRDRVPG